MARYIEGAVHGAHYDQKDVYLIYLTLDNSTDVSKQSWRRCNNGKKTDYENDFRGRYKHVTYRDHILPWLKNDLKRIVGDDRNLIGFVGVDDQDFYHGRNAQIHADENYADNRD